jgi:hypothetical protein
MANIIVYTNPYNAPLLFPFIREWWLYVTVTPEDNKITVFKFVERRNYNCSQQLDGPIKVISLTGRVSG